MAKQTQSLALRGFTFLELMVTLALISMLMAFLFPLLLEGRHSARRAACQSNLAQMGAALHLYAQDHDGRFPPTENDWTLASGAYAKNYRIILCPDEPQDQRSRYVSGTARSNSGRTTLYGSYTYRAGLSNDDPAEEPVSHDWGAWHDGGVNVLYLGGSVRWKAADQAPTTTKSARPLPVGQEVDASGDLNE